MKKILFLSVILFSVLSFSQELSQNYNEYSYSQFFNMIEAEKDSIFKLNDALIIYNEKTDQRFAYKLNIRTNEVIDVDTTERIVVDKRIQLENVQFKRTFGQRVSENVNEYKGSLYNIQFKKAFEIRNSASFYIYNCIFNSPFISENSEICKLSIDFLRSKNLLPSIEIHYTTFNNLFVLNKNCRDKNSILDFNFKISNSTFNTFKNSEDSSSQFFILSVYGNSWITFNNNTIHNLGEVLIFIDEPFNITLNNNDFSFINMILAIKDQKGAVKMLDNVFHDEVRLEIDGLKSQDQIDWSQFEDKLVSNAAKLNILRSLGKEGVKRSYLRSKKFNKLYKDSIRYHNKIVYGNEVGLIGTFYNYYKSKYNTEVANEVYLELKDFETKRFEVLHQQNPSFKTYFTWKVNQFLKIFSAYGTEPARAIVFSLYVILFFAFIYLLFPNTWDTLGNRRLMSRFEFFQKYLRRKEGMHTIYLEGKKEEISSYEDFKNNLENSKTELPSFFISWSKPLYNASMFSSKITARFLQNTDILKGKWKDLSPKQKRWKNIQIGFLLTLGLVYDLFIKTLNALMLSINTFTTLGFGEIPIKGLPRYLAIIQGFIGWFMLTIFSVSLISQLLN